MPTSTPMTFKGAKEKFNEEILQLVSINERFDDEPDLIKDIRWRFAERILLLQRIRDEAGRSFAGRQFSIAITHLEEACMRAVKGVYNWEQDDE